MPPLIAPFAAVRPAHGRAAEVAAPPYDVITTEEARARAADRPWDFLHVSRPEIDLPPDADPHGDEAYAKAASNFSRMQESGVLVRDDAPCYYVYRIVSGGHTQTGLAAAAHVPAYSAGRIRRHEHTRPDKEMDRARQIEAVGAHTGPVFVTHRADAVVARLLNTAAAGNPDSDVTLDDKVRHQVWAVKDKDRIERLSSAFEGMERLYVADGHHRAAAATRVFEKRPTSDRFLVVSFPADQVRILDYNRVVRDLQGRTPEAFLSDVREHFTVEPSDLPYRPERRGEFGMFVADRWYRLAQRDTGHASENPVTSLDVSRLADGLLSPILGIGDPRTDPRIDFVGGSRGLNGLEDRVRSGEWAVAFSLYPTSLEDLMAVADAGEVMPPKSTWFDPKLADGLLSLPLG
ncbi:MAG: DUF1015 domain-containing protein [Rhodospirillales bacterium]|nr:DUF1015 domain-containing protein [Rhodospirillales bacterium]